MPVMKEIAQAFDDELRETAMTRFRGQGTATEVNMAFMSISEESQLRFLTIC